MAEPIAPAQIVRDARACFNAAVCVNASRGDCTLSTNRISIVLYGMMGRSRAQQEGAGSLARSAIGCGFLSKIE
jgi:hypothetical protein